MVCGGFSAKCSKPVAGLKLRDFLGYDLGSMEQVEAALSACLSGRFSRPQELHLGISGKALCFHFSHLQLGDRSLCNLVVTLAAGGLQDPGDDSVPVMAVESEKELSGLNLTPPINGCPAADDSFCPRDSLVYSSRGKESEHGEASSGSCRRYARNDVGQESVESQTDFSIFIPTKAGLPPSGIRAEDAARAAAFKLKANCSAAKARGLEGMWTLLGDHEKRVGAPMLRLTFSRGSCLDNEGFKHFVVKKGQWASVGRHCLSMEGANLLHLDPPSGARLSYTRGEGGYEVGRPVLPGTLKLNYLAPIKLAIDTAEIVTTGSNDLPDDTQDHCEEPSADPVAVPEDIRLEETSPPGPSRSVRLTFSTDNLRALMQSESEDD